ncbi:hypothetical protein PABG_12369 [Paracoccidioides brasiliensis Pb03]|nr:hypothetical protein PABG_12369 [Paracoccidioides brasiliensis Pb03]
MAPCASAHTPPPTVRIPRHARVADHAAPDIGSVSVTWPVPRAALNSISAVYVRAHVVIDAYAVRARTPLGSRNAPAVNGLDGRCDERDDHKR